VPTTDAWAVDELLADGDPARDPPSAGGAALRLGPRPPVATAVLGAGVFGPDNPDRQLGVLQRNLLVCTLL
jgi:hypothetical protein